MRSVLVAISMITLVIALFYAAVSFYWVSFDPTTWNEDARALVSIFSLFTVVIGIITYVAGFFDEKD